MPKIRNYEAFTMALMSVADAKARILANVEPLEAQTIALDDAGGRVLAADVAARLTQPPFDASAMDGYAVRAQDLAETPTTLSVIGVSAAGAPFAKPIDSGEAVRIFTGAKCPEGADTVIIQEDTRALDDNRVEVLAAVQKGAHIRWRGIDFQEGAVLLTAGQVLRSRHLMLAAAMNHASVSVRRKPKVALIATGDELQIPGSRLDEGQIVSSIPSGLKAALEQWGADVRVLGIARDTRESLEEKVREGEGADVLVTIGGASVGDHDLVKPVLEGLGTRFDVLKIAMRPGKPLMFGFRQGQRVLGLPGNPVSAFICARIFLKPLIEALLGLPEKHAVPSQARLGCGLEANGDREHYLRGTLHDGVVHPLSNQDSSLVAAFASANCLIRREAFAPPRVENDVVTVLPLDF